MGPHQFFFINTSSSVLHNKCVLISSSLLNKIQTMFLKSVFLWLCDFFIFQSFLNFFQSDLIYICTAQRRRFIPHWKKSRPCVSCLCFSDFGTFLIFKNFWNFFSPIGYISTQRRGADLTFFCPHSISFLFISILYCNYWAGCFRSYITN